MAPWRVLRAWRETGLALKLSHAVCSYRIFIICLNSLAFSKLRILPALQSFCEVSMRLMHMKRQEHSSTQ